jgi:NADPH:quinone reductase-like Zn-dependent oxidoreductase
MIAWRTEKHGGPEVLKQCDLPVPECGPMQARVRVQAVGLNHVDLWIQKGVEGHKFHLPMIPGGDISGVIDELGAGAKTVLSKNGLEVGSDVLINPGISCGQCEACLGGFDPLCRSYGMFGETQNGGCAEFVVVPIANLIRRPKQVTAIAGASLAIPYLTAWTMLMRKAQIKPGETILIQAGGSGVSVAATQMAKLMGATVITTVGSDDKIEKSRALGADHVINYKKTPFREEVKKFLTSQGKKGCEVVLDHVGADTFQDSVKCLNWGGRLVTCGATSGSQVPLDLKMVFFKNISILGSTMGSKSDFIRIVDLIASGKLKSVVDTVYPLKELPSAFERLHSRNVFGKVVLQVS